MVFRFASLSEGAVIVVTEIANNLAKLGHKITVLTPDLDLKGKPYTLKFIKMFKKQELEKIETN